MGKGKKPDFKLGILNKRTNEKGYVGAAWENDAGHISIVLNTAVHLFQSTELVLTLFPNTPMAGTEEERIF